MINLASLQKDTVLLDSNQCQNLNNSSDQRASAVAKEKIPSQIIASGTNSITINTSSAASSTNTVRSSSSSSSSASASASASAFHLPSNPSFPEEYTVLIGCLPKDTLNAINDVLSSSSFQDKFETYWDSLNHSIDHLDYCSQTFSRDEIAYTILEGLKRGRLSGLEAASLLHIHTLARTGYILECCPLDTSVDSSIDKLASSSSCLYLPFDRQELIDLISSLPKSQKVLFLIRNKESKLVETVFNADSYAVPFTFDFREDLYTSDNAAAKAARIRGAESRLFVPFGMHQAYLNRQFPGSETVRLRPILGVSTVASIKSCGLTSERDIFIPFLDKLKLPDSVDTRTYDSPFDIAIHDIYHSMQLAFIPRKYRAPLVHAAQAVRDNMKAIASDQAGQNMLKKIAWQVFDLELPRFRNAYIFQKIDNEEPNYNEVLIKQIDAIISGYEKVAASFQGRALTSDEKIKLRDIFMGKIQEMTSSNQKKSSM